MRNGDEHVLGAVRVGQLEQRTRPEQSLGHQGRVVVVRPVEPHPLQGRGRVAGREVDLGLGDPEPARQQPGRLPVAELAVQPRELAAGGIHPSDRRVDAHLVQHHRGARAAGSSAAAARPAVSAPRAASMSLRCRCTIDRARCAVASCTIGDQPRSCTVLHGPGRPLLGLGEPTRDGGGQREVRRACSPGWPPACRRPRPGRSPGSPRPRAAGRPTAGRCRGWPARWPGSHGRRAVPHRGWTARRARGRRSPSGRVLSPTGARHGGREQEQPDAGAGRGLRVGTGELRLGPGQVRAHVGVAVREQQPGGRGQGELGGVGEPLDRDPSEDAGRGRPAPPTGPTASPRVTSRRPIRAQSSASAAWRSAARGGPAR